MRDRQSAVCETVTWSCRQIQVRSWPLLCLSYMEKRRIPCSASVTRDHIAIFSARLQNTQLTFYMCLMVMPWQLGGLVEVSNVEKVSSFLALERTQIKTRKTSSEVLSAERLYSRVLWYKDSSLLRSKWKWNGVTKLQLQLRLRSSSIFASCTLFISLIESEGR